MDIYKYSPYWIQSYDDAFMNFKHMGLWTYCFDHFRFPHYQFDKLFDGCNTVFSEEYYVIREWLIPGNYWKLATKKKSVFFTMSCYEMFKYIYFIGWLLFLEFCMTMAILLSLGTLAMIGAILTRYPQRLVLKYEYMLSAACFLATTISGL